MDEQFTPYSKLQDNRKNLANLIPLQMPFGLYVDPSNFCNFKCICCPRNFSDFQKYAGAFKHMELDLFMKIIGELHDWGRLRVLRLYYLGEPLLNPNFDEMVRMAASYNVAERIEITSNGSMLKEKHCRELIDIAGKTDTPIYFRVSIYSVIQERHTEITKSSISIEEIKNNIVRLRQMRDLAGIKNPIIYVKMIDALSDENNLFLEMYHNIADELAIEEAHNWSGYEERELLGNLYKEKRPGLIKPQKSRKACSRPFFSLAINTDGSVVCCCVDWTRSTKIGNVREQTLKEIWNSDSLKRIQVMHLEGKRHLNEACRNCELLNGCLDDIDNVPVEQLF